MTVADESIGPGNAATAFTEKGTIPPVTAEPAKTGATTASDQGFEAAASPGAQALKHLLAHDPSVKASGVATVMKQFPNDHREMFALLHQQHDTAYVDQVVAAMEGPKQPAQEPVAEAAPAAAAPAVAEAVAKAPDAAAPSTGKTEEPAAAAAAADPEKQDSAISPDVRAKYIGAARAFITRHLKLTHEQGELLQFEDSTANNAINLEVTNVPEVVIAKPDGKRTVTESGYNDNFYATLPKDIKPPGMSQVAHVMLNGSAVDGKDGMVKISGPMRIQFVLSKTDADASIT